MSAKEHDSPNRFISITRARCIARYRMRSIPGRPEELVCTLKTANSHNPDLRADRTISFAYAGGEMRIRKHGGKDNREWIEVRDFQLRGGWLSEVYEFLDPFFGLVTPPGQRTPDDPPRLNTNLDISDRWYQG